MNGVVTMDKNDQKNYTLAIDVIYGKLTICEFSTLTKKSYRQSQRIIKKVKEKGMLAFQHGNTGRTPWNKHPEELKNTVLDIYKKNYLEFNLTHFRHKLKTDHGIDIKAETMRKWAHELGQVKNKRRRSRKTSYKIRPRLPQEGLLVQFDGSEHAWFGPKKNIYTLIGGMDDATGEILYLEFFAGEDTFNCMKCMKNIIDKKGIPHSFYLDRAGHFGKPYSDQNRTQIGRALEELNCKVILASTPQAKGRIERLWRTLQDRLIAELRLKNISKVRAANKYLQDIFIPHFNTNFTVKPRLAQSAFTRVPRHIDLDKVFCIKEQRRIMTGNCFSFENEKYVIDYDYDVRFRYIDILCHDDGRIEFELMGKEVSAYKLSELSNNEEEIKKIA